MKKIFTASIFVFAFCVFTFGQISNCPTISVTGPSTPPEPKEPMKFTATVTGIDVNKIRYKWSVSEGEIVQGQGTDTIFIRSNSNKNEFTPTVTVDIEGLAKGCQSSDSETAVMVDTPITREIDSFELTANPINAERLDALVLELENDPNAMVGIIIYNKGESPSKPVKEKEAFIKKYLSDKKIAGDRISIVYSAGDDTDRVRIFVVPAGAEPPMP